MDQAFNSRELINLIVASKHPRHQWFSIEEAEILVKQGLKVIDWASTNINNPDLVIASSGSEPTEEALATISILKQEFPAIKLRYVNVVDLLRLRSKKLDPRGLSNEEFVHYFTQDRPVIFAFHGYEGLIKDLFFDQPNHNLHVHGYRENGDITTPFDMRVLSEMDRFHMAKHAAELLYADKAQDFATKMDSLLTKHHSYIREYGMDIPEVETWNWA